MSGILRNIATDEIDTIGDTSTLAEPEVVDSLIANKGEWRRESPLGLARVRPAEPAQPIPSPDAIGTPGAKRGLGCGWKHST